MFEWFNKKEPIILPLDQPLQAELEVRSLRAKLEAAQLQEKIDIIEIRKKSLQSLNKYQSWVEEINFSNGVYFSSEEEVKKVLNSQLEALKTGKGYKNGTVRFEMKYVDTAPEERNIKVKGQFFLVDPIYSDYIKEMFSEAFKEAFSEELKELSEKELKMVIE